MLMWSTALRTPGERQRSDWVRPGGARREKERKACRKRLRVRCEIAV